MIMSKIFDYVITKLLYLIKSRVYILYTDDKPYLMRVYLKHKGKYPAVFLHKFLDSDQDRDLHDHPFLWSKSFILTGSYIETRLHSDKTTEYKRVLSAPAINNIAASDFHKVTLDKQPVWTLFIAGPIIKSWGFWVAEKQKYVVSEEYLSGRKNYCLDLDGNRVKLPY